LALHFHGPCQRRGGVRAAATRSRRALVSPGPHQRQSAVTPPVQRDPDAALGLDDEGPRLSRSLQRRHRLAGAGAGRDPRTTGDVDVHAHDADDGAALVPQRHLADQQAVRPVGALLHLLQVEDGLAGGHHLLVDLPVEVGLFLADAGLVGGLAHQLIQGLEAQRAQLVLVGAQVHAVPIAPEDAVGQALHHVAQGQALLEEIAGGLAVLVDLPRQAILELAQRTIQRLVLAQRRLRARLRIPPPPG
jgi:hypothetical protein